MGRAGAILSVAFAALAASVALAPATAASPATTGTPSALSALETGIVAELNVIRRAHHLVTLRVHPALAAAARAHSRDMVAKGYFEHEGLDGKPFWTRVDRLYASPGVDTSLGENLLWASGDLTAKAAVADWMASQGHRENILDRTWREVGIGAAFRRAAPGDFEGLDVTVVTADFGVRTSRRATLRSAHGRP
jgi:uncharacterized protein YkwD